MALSQDADPVRAAAATQGGESSDAGSAALTPEIVREVADKVFALMLQDLRIEFERTRTLRTRRW